MKYIVEGTTGSGRVRKKDLITSQIAYISVLLSMRVCPIIQRINTGVGRKLAGLTVIERVLDAIDFQSRSRDAIC